ncbi:MAG: murein biosynthesis integral membrane protein MurJ, partial [Acidobacteriaceae bacterium]|nr:murein biosynthesis integral membrane protein MurJ [Acidobacteriaceae bacterium]
MAISIDRLASPLAGRSDRGTTAAAAECAQVARSAGVLSMAILLSRMSGLVREVFMAHEFGAGFSYDAFLLGFRIPNLTRDLFAEGALSAAFIPAFTGVLKKEGRAAAEELSNVVATATMTVVAVVCVVGMIFSPQIVGLLAPGFASVPGKFALTVHMTRLMFPFLLFIALAAQATGILNSSGKFGIPGIASVFFNVGSVLVAFVLGFVLGPFIGISRIDGMAYGTTIGGLLQLAWQMPWVFRQGFRFKPAFNWSHPGLRLIFQMMLPAIVTSAAVQINVIVNSCFASELSDPVRGPNGPVSWLAYAFRLVHLPLGIFGVAIASAMLPSVSR